jgi:RNA polymerase sigma-70 factor (ECF subfamily)
MLSQARRLAVSFLALRSPMATLTPSAAAIAEDAATGELVTRAASSDEVAIRTIMRRYNRRLYHLARSILKDDDEADDAVQQGYIKAFAHIGEFRGQAELGSWLGRIVINVALDERRRKRPTADRLDDGEEAGARVSDETGAVDPERSLAQREISALLERAIDALPQAFRTVLVARIVEELSVEETAALLGISPETAKTRLHRARRLIRAALGEHIGPGMTGVFPFDGWRCDRLSDRVIAALNKSAPTQVPPATLS